jgi:hypothetical protein
MAKPSVIEARKARAIEDLGRKIDLIMEHLGIRDPQASSGPDVEAEIQAAAEAEAQADAEAAERAAQAEADAEKLANDPNRPAAEVVGTEAATGSVVPQVELPTEKPQPSKPRSSAKKK